MTAKKELRYKIEYDRQGCIGAGACTAVSKNWKMEDDGKANPVKTEFSEEEFEEQLEAAQVCPVNVIHIIDKHTGKKII